MNFVFAPAAIQDLDEISQYFLENDVEAGEKLFQELNKRFQNLTRFPQMGRLYPHLHPEIRGLSVRKYIVFYRISSLNLEIVRIFDGRRNLKKELFQ
jgi:toxin ParE1/3/4